MHKNAIETKAFSYRYPDGTSALSDIDITIAAGESVALLGPNGAGKSTFALHLNGLLRPSAGKIIIFGDEITKSNMYEIRRRVGLVFQNPEDQLFCPTVFDDIAFGLKNMGLKKDEIESRIKHMLDEMGLGHLAGRNAYHLSLGQKKRAALASVLVMEPQIIVIDEPLAFLDPSGQKAFFHTIGSLQATKIIITHSPAVARAMCNKVIVLNNGKIASEGTCGEILNDNEILKANGLDFSL